MVSSMRDNAAKVAEDEAERLISLADKAPNPEAELQTLGRATTARVIARVIRALPIEPDPTRAALEAIARDMPFRGPNGFENYSAAYSRLKQMARNALQED